MTDKSKYWIRDVEGVYALVAGSAERDQWVKVHGWAEAEEPGPTDQVHVTNENPEIGPGRLPYAAVADWAGLGWTFGPPSFPAPETPAPGPAAKSPAKTSASSGES